MAEDEFELDDDLDEGLRDGDDVFEHDDVVPESFFAKNRRLILFSIIGGVFLIGSIIFGAKLLGGDDNKSSVTQFIGNSVQQSSTDQAKEVKKKKKKKKKKIKYAKLFNQLDGNQTSKILKELSFNDILFSTEQAGKNFSILVDEDQEEEARNLLAIKGLPSGAVKGYELLDDAQTLGVTEFDKRIRFLRALSGELEKGIIQFIMIEDAKVQIVLPEQRLFAVVQPPVTSSILIRKVDGMEVNDDVVFSIIQLVSNAVENLQQENVSVIDTEGFVLSEGIFERLASRKEKRSRRAGNKLTTEDETKTVKDAPGQVIGRPIIPDFMQIRDWFEVKKTFEETLVEKGMRQLKGILPLGTYKVAVTSDIGPLVKGKVVDIRRLTIGIVVDNLSDEVYLDAETKRQIFNTVAGAVGYVRGRDSIQLSKADFTLYSPEEKEALIKKYRDQQKGGILLMVSLAILLIFGLIWGGVTIRRRRKATMPALDLKSDEDSDFGGLQDELTGEKNLERLRSLASMQPDIVAKVMEKWLQTELSQQALNNAQDVQDDDELDEDGTTNIIPEASPEDSAEAPETLTEEEPLTEEDFGLDTDLEDTEPPLDVPTDIQPDTQSEAELENVPEQVVRT